MRDFGSYLMMVVAGVIGLLGLFLASRASDLGFEIFGLALAGFAIVYIFTMLRLSGAKT